MQEEKNQKIGGEKKGLKSLFAGLGGLGGWFGALIGRPKAPQVPVSTEPTLTPTENTPVSQGPSAEEDSIKTDIEGVKLFVKRGVKQVSTKVAPLAKEGVELSGEAITGASGLVEKSFLKKLIRVFLIVLFLIILVFVSLKLFSILRQKTEPEKPPVVPASPIPYLPYKPSVYAGDPEVLQLEEDASVLETELASTSVREDRLKPPSLDFDVRF